MGTEHRPAAARHVAYAHDAVVFRVNDVDPSRDVRRDPPRCLKLPLPAPFLTDPDQSLAGDAVDAGDGVAASGEVDSADAIHVGAHGTADLVEQEETQRDRKSTRLNSS